MSSAGPGDGGGDSTQPRRHRASKNIATTRAMNAPSAPTTMPAMDDVDTFVLPLLDRLGDGTDVVRVAIAILIGRGHFK